MDNVEVGIKSGAWRLRQVYVVKVGVDADGNDILQTTYTKPDREEDIVSYVSLDQNLPPLTKGERLQHRVTIVQDGKQYVVELESEELANTLNGKFEEAVALSQRMDNIQRGMVNFMSAINTQYNPVFPIRNFLRDFQLALISNIGEQDAKFTAKFVANIGKVQGAIWKYVGNEKFRGKEVFKNTQIGKYLEEYFEQGAQTGWSFLRDIEALNKDIEKQLNEGKVSKGLKATGNAIGSTLSFFTEVSELTVRVAQYVTAREMGKSAEEAAQMAKEISVNFDRKGSVSGVLSKFYSFFNASIQGTNKIVRMWKNSPKAKGTLMASAALYMALGILNTLCNPDDPEEEIWASDYTRKTNFMFGSFLLPVAHFFRVFYGTGVEIVRCAQGRKTATDAAWGIASSMMDEIIPASIFQVHNLWEYNEVLNELDFVPMNYLQGAAPSYLSPIVDVVINRNFMGGKVNKEPFIESDKELYKAGKFAMNNTHQAYVKIADFLSGGDSSAVRWTNEGRGISGSTIQHIAEGYTGGTGKFVVGLVRTMYKMLNPKLEVEIKDIPLVNQMVKPYRVESAYRQEYWELYRKLDRFKKGLSKAKKNPDKLREIMSSDQYRVYNKYKHLLKDKPDENTMYSPRQVEYLMNANKEWRETM
jgi:hypothetical protein